LALRIGISKFVNISLYAFACWNQPIMAPMEFACSGSTAFTRILLTSFAPFEVWSCYVDTTFCNFVIVNRILYR